MRAEGRVMELLGELARRMRAGRDGGEPGKMELEGRDWRPLVRCRVRAGRVQEAWRVVGECQDGVDIGCVAMCVEGFAKAGDVRAAGEAFGAMMRELEVRGGVEEGGGDKDDTVWWERALEAIVRIWLKAGRGVDDVGAVIGRVSNSARVKPTESTYGLMVGALCGAGRMADAVGVFNGMLDAGVKPSLWTLTKLVRGFVWRRDWVGMELAWDRVAFLGYAPDVVLATIMVGGRCKAGDMEGARLLFEAVRKGDWTGVVADRMLFNAMMDGLAKDGDVAACLALYGEMMRAGVKPDKATHTIVIDAHVREGDGMGAVAWLERWLGIRPGGVDMGGAINDVGGKPDVATFTSLIKAFGDRRDQAQASRWLDAAMAMGVQPNVRTLTAVIRACGRAGDPASAATWFGRLIDDGSSPEGNVKASASVTAHGRLAPDAMLFNTVIAAHVSSRNIEAAETVLAEMARRRVRPTSVTYSCVIDGYLREGNIQSALRVYRLMGQPGKITDGVGDATGTATEAVEPSLSTYVNLLTAMGHERGKCWSDGTRSPSRRISEARVRVMTERRLVENARKADGYTVTAGRVRSRLGLAEQHYDAAISFVYADFRRSFGQRSNAAESCKPPPIQPYDAVVAHWLSRGDLAPAQRVVEDMITDGVAPDRQIVIRLVRRLGRWKGWLACVFMCLNIREHSRARGCVDDQVRMENKRRAAQWVGQSVGAHLPVPAGAAASAGEGKYGEAERAMLVGRRAGGDRGGGTRPSASVRAEQLEACTNDVLLGSYAKYAFIRAWAAVRAGDVARVRECMSAPPDRMELGELRELEAAATFLRYDEIGRKHFVYGITTEQGARMCWDVSMRVQMTFRDPRRYVVGCRRKAVELNMIPDEAFVTFCMIFVRHCEKHAFWDVRQEATGYLEGMGILVEKAYMDWVRRQARGLIPQSINILR
ncbi:hypothetical protein HK101_008502 [Irineochytrium annulatum]|nr:hypothetical protein HK101_008502 [Irineochytrium annulatum]